VRHRARFGRLPSQYGLRSGGRPPKLRDHRVLPRQVPE
jgi:hypothetical protein